MTVSWPLSDFLSVSVKVNTSNGNDFAWEDINRYVTPRTCPNRAHCAKISSHPRGRVENIHNSTTHARIPGLHLDELGWPEGKIIQPNSLAYRASFCCEAEGFNLYLKWLILRELPDHNAVCSLFGMTKVLMSSSFGSVPQQLRYSEYRQKQSLTRGCVKTNNILLARITVSFFITACSNRELETRDNQ